ncbi:hypothetical protein Leryth_005393 [Lithospermum erythrorhizon]|nr:hypothetical protein Leryth_005393 [Lithospermum erythrorhizon]
MASPALAFNPLAKLIPNYNQLCYSTSASCSMKFPSMKQSVGSCIMYCGRQGNHLNKQRGHYQGSILCSMKFPTMDQFSDFSNFEKYLDHVNWRILEFTPDPVKRFPWKKAVNVALQQLLMTGKEALKLSLLAVFVVGSLSDIVGSISKSKELLVPLGLLVGCAISEFVKDVSQEFLNNNKDVDETWHLLGMGCIFLLLKIIAIKLSLEGQGFVLHVANGALMQVLWHLKSSGEVDSTSKGNDASEVESFG